MLEPLPNDDFIRCPNCAEQIRSGAILCRYCEKGLSEDDFSPCPYCAESIRVEAIFCRFCQTKIVDSKSQKPAKTKDLHPLINDWMGTFINKNPSRHNRQPGIKNASDFRELMLSIQTNQSSGCFKVTSPKHHSKGLLLIFRGRAIGCVYFNKRLEKPLFGKEAYGCICADVYQRDREIDAFLLSEDMVLSAASLFHGVLLHTDLAKDAQESFQNMYKGLIKEHIPGCMIIQSGAGTLSTIVYVFGGKIIGVNSGKEGWVSTSYEKALQFVDSDAKILVTKLAAANIDEVMKLSFSLSGLDDPKEVDDNEIFKVLSQGDLDKLLSKLSSREREVLSLRLGLQNGIRRTREEIAEMFSITIQRIVQIEAKILQKFRRL